MPSRKYQHVYTRTFACAILLLQCDRIIFSLASNAHQNGIRGTQSAEESGNDSIHHKAIEDLSIITMDELVDIHRRQQSEDDIHLNVGYSNHPHEVYRYLQTKNNTSLSSNLPSISPGITNIAASKDSSQTSAPTASPTSTNTEPIRIVYETTELDLVENHQRAIKAIKDEVLPEITNIWSSILSVTPVTENIPIPSNVCNGFFPNVPPSIEQNGVGNADIVVFVSGNSFSNGKQLCGSKTLASASFCNLDQVDRPVIGFINFCLENFDYKQVEKMTKVGVHEIAHILGWNDDMFKYFRDRETGEPLTPRPFKSTNVECVDGEWKDYELPSENTLKMKKDWISGKDRISYEIVTPNIKQAARNQFGCQELEGARLENRPTRNSCIGAHFDERYFFTEVMGPVLSSKSASSLSPLTLAILEDTGFYEVYYYGPHVQNGAFGLGAGCDFVTDSCVDNQSETVKESFQPYFCDTVTKFSANGVDQAANSTCDPSFTNIAYCDLIDFSEGAPSGYDPPDEDAISYFSDTNLGVLFTHANYCPVPALVAINCIDGPTSSHQKLYPGEEYGSASKCFNTRFQHPEDGLVDRGACLRTTCNKEDRNLVVHVDGNSLVCEFDGQVRNFPWTQSASFECPPLRSVCPELFCPGLCSAKGICNFESDPPKCECFDEDDTSEGCYGRDYRASANEQGDNKNPNSANAKSVALSSIILFFSFYMSL